MDLNVNAVMKPSLATHASYSATNIATTSESVLNVSTISTHIQKTSICTTSDDNLVINSSMYTNPSSPFDLIPEEILLKRRCLHETFLKRLEERKELYTEILTELFFLQNGGNSMDFVQFKKRPSNKLLDFLKRSRLDGHHSRNKNRENISSSDPVSPASYSKSLTKYSSDENGRPGLSNDTEESNKNSFKVLNERALQHSKTRLLSQEKSEVGSQKNMPKFFRVSGIHLQNHVTQTPHVGRQDRLSRHSMQSMLDENIDSQEEILERAKQEAVIQRKVVELRKQGLWTQRRLPKIQEPPRNKTHWDYLLEEMRWLSADFAQERKWKRAAARKLVRTVASYHKDQHDKVKKAVREEHQKLRRIASTMAREIKIFWNNIEKVVEYKQQSLLDEKRQKALDIHLSYIVDQTEKYSNWLSQGLNKTDSASSCPSPTNSNMKAGCDDDFLPQGESSDDEATIAVEEEELSKGDDHEDELSLLKKESQLPLEEWLQTLPTEIIENVGKLLENVPSKENLPQDESISSPDEDDHKPMPISLRRSARKRKIDSDENETGSGKVQKVEQSTDDKEDLLKQKVLQSQGTSNEISALQAEANMPIEELKKLYDGAFVENSVENIEYRTDSDTENETDESDSDSCEVAEEIGMDYLLSTNLSNEDDTPLLVPPSEVDIKNHNDISSPSKEITDVAAEAASLQPTGHTLATTQVVTPIPSLLRHDLREYQHIGLDWLVTMFDKRLNGILADEMGLGKTIQTIALLAHLACEKGVWGPHLIVVPTSVMLNWEMEFKKWCPGFKILTYYGSQKERKMKRVGWTKSNAFHVCITSYKLVLQDHVSFRRKKWKYLVLDEAQNIKNFKSQRWQTLLNFNSQRRLLLTGTPLQNNLMELWSLMHFLMPHVFQSHKEFKEWFSNPLTGMIEGSQDYNEKLVRRLHKVLRPFLLRRIKRDVEKQMPNKYEHIVKCHLSKRQRFLYDDFMSRTATKETLDTGHFMSVINVLMQLRKVCNHPNLFESRPIVSPFISNQIIFHTASIVTKILHKDPFETLNLMDLHLHLPTLCSISQYQAQRMKRLETPRKLIEEISAFPAQPRRQPSPKLGVREQLNMLLKNHDHHIQGASDSNAIQLNNSLHGVSQPITNTTGIIQSASSKPIFSSKVLAISQTTLESKAAQQIAVQYQTPQGVRVSIPNKQIRQLSGGYVQIVSSMTAKPDQVLKGNAVSKEFDDTSIPELYEAAIQYARTREQKDKRNRMALSNKRNCAASPNWLPYDTIKFLETVCLHSQRSSREDRNYGTKIESYVTQQLVKSSDAIATEMQPLTDRFVFPTKKVESMPVHLCISRPSPRYQKQLRSYEDWQKWFSCQLKSFHSIKQNMKIQFPDVRLVQYDCGKLQILDILLRRFWTEKHRCLIFTQMSRVLDILETFLSFHGYRYLRLDGSTKVEQRMSLMERFNNDSRIFCFILSTRSGGVGVNLTGADTVIFYDSDWNPTMDAQAQDRCHRIGQTRDVHIYRLISERTVEENILKKANQKRLLGDLAIEGGSFTTAFFREQAIKDLFNQPTGLEDLTADEEESKEKQIETSKPMTARQKAIAAAKLAEAKSTDLVTNKEVNEHPSEESSESKHEPNSWEDALQETEEKEDVDAAKLAKKEQDADLEEFSGNIDDEDVGETAVNRSEISKVQMEMKSLYAELTPIEQYALRYLEETTMEINNEELEQAEQQVTKSKEDWEMSHLMALKEEEERRLEEEDEIFYVREDMENQVFVDDFTGTIMPTWFPPTPPQVDNDVYIDSVSGLLYYSTPMLEDDLPQIHVKKESRKTRTIADNTGAVGVPRKLMRGDIRPPRSLFIRPLSHVKKKEVKKSLLKKQSNVLLHQREFPVLPTLSHDKENDGNKVDQSEAQTFEIKATMNPDWLVNEDWTLLRALQQVLEMPLSLSVLMPAHTPNWDLVSDIVNSISSVYRSPKMCKQRFENVIAPREGNVSSETSFRKKMKAVPKTPVKLKMNKQQKTLNMHTHDGNFQHTSLYSSRFEAISETCSKRTLPLKTSGTGQFQRNPKHTSILMDNGIVYDKPLQPIQVAALRAERISREKQAVEMAKQQQIVQSQVLHQQSIPQITTGQMKSSGVSSGGTNSIIVNSSTLTALKVASPKTTKTAMNNTMLQQTLLRAGNLQQTSQPLQPQIQTHPQNQGAMVTVGLLHCLTSTGVSSITTAITTSNTITQHSLTRPSTSMSAGPSITQMQIQKQFSKQRLQQQTQLQLQKQQKKTVKSQITPQRLQITPEAMKQLRQQQQLGANVVTVAKVSGKQRQTASITPQELQQLLIKNSNMRRSMQKGQTTQVQIAPVQAHVQAQQVQVAAAQQAAQHVLTSKPLPITVPVSSLTSVAGVNLGGVNMSISTTNPISSNRAAPLVVTGQQVPVNIQQQLFQQQHLLKQKMSQQQQNRPVLASKAGKQVFAMVATPLISQSKRQIQQPSSQPPHVVKQAMQQVSTQDSQPGLSQQVKSSQITTQIVQHHQIASAAIVPSTGLNQRLVTGQRQVQQIQQLNTNRPQTILAPASPVISTQQYISGAPQNMAASGSSIPSQQQHVTLFSASKFPQQLQNLLTPSQQVSLHSQQPGCTSQPILHAISSNSQQFLLSQQGNRIQPAPNAVATPMNLVGSSLVQLPVSATSSLNNPLQASSTGGQHTTTQSQ